MKNLPSDNGSDDFGEEGEAEMEEGEVEINEQNAGDEEGKQQEEEA